MIKFDKDEFLKPQIYSTNDERETRCNVTKEIVDDVKQLQKENQELKKQLEENKLNHKQLKDLDKIEKSFIEIKNQQQEFIEYLEKIIEELECDNVDDEEMKGYLIQRIYTFKEILSKYKEIIGGKDEV